MPSLCGTLFYTVTLVTVVYTSTINLLSILACIVNLRVTKDIKMEFKVMYNFFFIMYVVILVFL